MFDFLPHINPIDMMKDPLHRIEDMTKKITRPVWNFGDNLTKDLSHLPGNTVDFIQDAENKLIHPVVEGIQGAGYPLIFGLSLPVIMGLGLAGIILLKVL